MTARSRRPAPRRLGKKLLQIRTALGLSQTGMVKRLDYTESPLYAAQISNFEQNKREPPMMLVLAYANVAQVPMEWLVDDKMDLPKMIPASAKERLDHEKKLHF